MTGQTQDRTATRTSSSGQVVRDIVRGLYEGRYVAGQRLVEPDLMRRYQVGRSTVREALSRLAAEGVATLNPFRGAQIRQLSRREAGNILVILEVTVGLAARLAAENIKAPGASAHFRACYDELTAFASERESFELVRARNRFYRAMTRVGRNPDLQRLLFGFQVHLIRSTFSQPHEERFADYRRMADAILAQDAKAAEKAGRDHIRRIALALAKAPDEAFALAGDEDTLSFNLEDTDDA
jgi:DNA-binding GntR family transcriptional regulator